MTNTFPCLTYIIIRKRSPIVSFYSNTSIDINLRKILKQFYSLPRVGYLNDNFVYIKMFITEKLITESHLPRMYAYEFIKTFRSLS